MKHVDLDSITFKTFQKKVFILIYTYSVLSSFTINLKSIKGNHEAGRFGQYNIQNYPQQPGARAGPKSEPIQSLY